MDLIEFKKKFGDDNKPDKLIRVKLNWSSLDQCQIKSINVYLSQCSNALMLAAYRDDIYNCVPYNHANANLVSVADAVDDKFTSWRQQNDIKDNFKGETICIPVYQLPEGRFLILDGLHRIVAAALQKNDIKLELVVLQGPIDKSILPDLIHYDK